jgi:tRNA1(Val) A37 N6-methylase TrmN6
LETARALGAWYTPAPLAEPLTRWAVRSPDDSVFDPSCGDGAFLAAAVSRLLTLGTVPRRLPDLVAGVDVDPSAVARARGALLSRHPALRWGRLERADYFRWAAANLGRVAFDAVVGNPPYLRTQGRGAAEKRLALELARRAGAELGADASLWAPFVAVASAFVAPGGRLAMVVPREALFVNYARPVRALLERRFGRVELEPLEGEWFEGALVKVALLRAGGAPAARRPELPWVWSRVPAAHRDAAARALRDPALAKLSDLATLLVGVVTGERDYFLPADPRSLPARFLVPAVSTPSELPGSVLRARDLPSARLLAIPPGYAGGHAALDRYLAEGEAAGIHRNYKCRTRSPWYSVRRQLPPPDLLLGYLMKRRPRMAANEAGAHSTNNVHRLWLKAGRARPTAAAAYSAPARLSIELTGRVSAAGALKIEPGDAPKILLPRLAGAGRVDALLRAGRDADAFDEADGLAREALGWSAETMRSVRRAADALRDARLA